MGKKFLLVLLGPTAVGKTDLSIEIAKHFHTSIISADSRQFFKEMNIGTAKPTKEQLEAVPHFFIDFLSIHENFDAFLFEEQALALLNKLFETNKIVIVSGGSGLYIDALCKGLDDLPEPKAGLREELIQLHQQKGLSHLQELLLEKDPEYYGQVDLKNPQRLIRALEVCITTGKPFSSFRKRVPRTRGFKIIYIGLSRQREELYQRINQRVDAMIEEGLLEEVEGLKDFGHLNALQTVGYREFFEYFNGTSDLEATIEKVKQNTRRYAKRQLTWFRKNPETKWFHPEEKNQIIEFVNGEIAGEDYQPI
jgi:tRNA dimethylallyltransferase